MPGTVAPTPPPSLPLPTSTARAFRHVNRVMVALWRLGLGRWVNVWPHGSGRILVLGHTGRRTGRRRWTPLNYAEVDGELYCTAGFGTGSDWYRNVLAEPEVELWLPGRRTPARVHEISDHPQRLPLLREVLLASGFAARLAGVDPRATDTRLAGVTESYRLLRLQPVVGQRDLPAHPRPGDWAWCWAVPAGLVVGGMSRRRLRHRRPGCRERGAAPAAPTSRRCGGRRGTPS